MSEILKSVIIDNDTLFNNFDLETVVTYPKNKHLNMSCFTNDGYVYLHTESKQEYELEEFAFRNWAKVHQILSSFYNPKYADEFHLTVNLSNNYPQSIKCENNGISLVHYLQNYDFISRSDDMLSAYKKKKLYLDSSTIIDEVPTLNDTMVKSLVQIGNILNEEFFTIQCLNNSLYFTYGINNTSIDSGKVRVEPTYTDTAKFSENYMFSVKEFSNIFKALSNENLKIQLFKDKIIFVADNDISTKMVILRAKRR